MSLIKKLTGVTYGGGVKIRRDAVIDDGTLFLFDFANPHCSPLTGTLAVGATIANLVDGAPVATGAGAGTATFGTKGLTFNGSDAMRVDMGTTYSLASTDHDFLIIIWLSFPAARLATDVGVFGLAFSNADCECLVRQNGADSLLMYADGHQAYWAGSVGNITLPTGVAVAPKQYAMAWVKTVGGANIETYIDGVFQKSTFYADSDLSAVVGSNNGSRMGGGASQQYGGATKWKGTIHRVLKEDLTVSGATAAAQVLLDYNRNSTRFV